MSPLHLRPMTPADIPRGIALLLQLGYDMPEAELARRYAEVTGAPDHRLIVAETAGEVVGLMHVFARPAVENPREAVVQAIVVDRDCRRGGIGRALMAEAERWGAERGCRSVTLSSNVTRAPAHAFYAALGYRVAATALVFRKPL
jgi:ribosomal protein S18 acetylase RimI-like enzyme